MTHSTSQASESTSQHVQSDASAIKHVVDTLGELEALTVELQDVAGEAIAPLDYMLPSSFLLSVVIPVYNEEKTLASVIARVRSLPFPVEIVVVDDGSSDGTRVVMDRLATLPEVRTIYKAVNGGKGSAIRQGFAAATGDVVIVQDADLEYDPADIPQVIQPIVTGIADVAYGSRFLSTERTNDARWHRWGNRALTWVSNRFTGLSLTDMETCYKAFRRNVLRSFELSESGFGIEVELTSQVAKSRVRVEEVPISYHPRAWNEGKKIGIADLFDALSCIVRYARIR